MSDLLDTLFLRSYNTRLVVLGTALLGLACGVVGVFLLLRKRSLMGDALSHATLPGIGLAFAVLLAFGGDGKNLLGLLCGATVSGLLGVLVMLGIRNTTRLRDDVAMGLVLSVFFGTGVAILRMVQTLPGANAAGLESFIYGKAASMVWSDFLLIGLGCTACAAAAFGLRKELTLLCFDEAFAATTGWPVLFLDVVLLALVTAVTVIGLQSVGLILIIALLIIPAASARFWTHRLSWTLALSAGIGGVSGWWGATVSSLFSDLPAGAIIVLVAASIFLMSLLFGRTRGVVPKLVAQSRLQRRVGRQHLLRAAYELLEAEGQPVANRPIRREALQRHRSWSSSELARLLAHARHEDHLEPMPDSELVHLSESGFGEAARITRNHRLWELYLIRHADIAPSHVDRDADLVEHILGPEMVRALEAELRPRPVIPSSPHRI